MPCPAAPLCRRVYRDDSVQDPRGIPMKKTLILLAVLAALTGCATVDGIGRDISGGANRVAGWIG